MTKFSNVLGKTCIACGQERKKKDMIAYDPATFEPLCVSPYFCNEEHPNSPKNILKNGKVTELLSYDEAREAYNAYIDATHSDPEKVKKIRRMVEHPMTIRIGSPDLAEFILDLQEDMNFSSISDTVRFCIQRMQEEKGGFHQKVKTIQKEKQESENLQKVTAAPVQTVTMPKVQSSSNEDEWSF